MWKSAMGVILSADIRMSSAMGVILSADTRMSSAMGVILSADIRKRGIPCLLKVSYSCYYKTYMSDDNPWLELIIILALILLNGFFSLAEMSIVSSRKTRLKTKADSGKKAYAKAFAAAENPSPYLSAVQIGITLIGILTGAFGGATIARNLEFIFTRVALLAPYAPALGVGVVVIAITIVTILLGELVPKRIALSSPERIAVRVVPILDIFTKLFMPLVVFLSFTSNSILKLFHIKAADKSITEEELRIALIEGEHSGVVEKNERAMVEGVFYLGDRPVDTFMTHRSELSYLEPDASEAEIREAALANRDGVLLIAKDNLDQVIGCVPSSDALAALVLREWKGLKPLMKKPCFIPGTMSALKAFDAFKRGGARLLLIMDEYGGLAGSLSISDLMEEIVGELSDVEDRDKDIFRRDDGSYLIDGSTNLDDIIDLFHLSESLPRQRDFHTLAGFILDLAGYIPKTGEVFEWNGYRLEIVDMDANRIDKVLLTPPAETALA